MDFIRGEDREQAILLPDCLDDYVADDNAVRVIDAFVDGLDLAALGFEDAEPQQTGRPMYDRKDLLKLYVYGYTNRTRSSRRLEAETKRNLEAIWLLRRLSPDHKTIADFRKKNAAALKNVFRAFVKLCLRLGLYGRELAAIDGSKFKAVNSRKRNFTAEQLRKKLEKAEEKIAAYLEELDGNDRQESGFGGGRTAAEIAGIVAGLTERRERYAGWAEEMEAAGATQKSLTDPESRLMATSRGMDVCYNVQTAVDGKHKLIAAYEVSSQGNDKNFISPMAAGVQEALEVERLAVVADGGYESIQDMLKAMGHGVEVHVAGTDFDICVPAAEGEAEAAAGAEITGHHKGRCVYIAGRNIALCPMGKVLYPSFYKEAPRFGVYRNRAACSECACKCAKTASDSRGFQFQVPMEPSAFTKEYDDRKLAVKQVRIAPDKELVRRRKAIVEHPFGTVKRAMDAGYCLMKGLRKVKGEFALAFLAYNLKRAVNILGCAKLLAAMA